MIGRPFRARTKTSEGANQTYYLALGYDSLKNAPLCANLTRDKAIELVPVELLEFIRYLTDEEVANQKLSEESQLRVD